MNAGTKIVRSCELVENIWMQVQELGNSLSAMTQSALENGDFTNLQSAGSSKWGTNSTESGWSTTAYAINFPVKEKKRRKSEPNAWINYQISVFGSGVPPMENGGQESAGPVVHVSFWHEETNFKYPGFFVEFPPAWDDCELRDNRLLFWENEQNNELPQWTFSIRLLDLKSEDALRTSIIEPMQKLLAGAPALAALPADLPGLVFYTDINQGDSGESLMVKESNARP